MKMKSLLGFAVLVIYTFSMLAWGGMSAAQACKHAAPLAHHLVPLACRAGSDPTAR